MAPCIPSQQTRTNSDPDLLHVGAWSESNPSLFCYKNVEDFQELTIDGLQHGTTASPRSEIEDRQQLIASAVAEEHESARHLVSRSAKLALKNNGCVEEFAIQ